MSKLEVLSGTEKPLLNDVDVDSIPVNIRGEARWLAWDFVQRDGKWVKVPIHFRDGKWASASDPNIFGTLTDVIEAGRGDGIGFALGDGWVGLDLDDCRDPLTGELTEQAQDIVNRVGSYAEVSPTLTGVKIFARADLPETLTGTVSKDKSVEFYKSGRFFTVTGLRVISTPEWVEYRTAELLAVHRDYIGTQPQTQPVVSRTTANSNVAQLVDALQSIKPRAAESDGSRRLYAYACRIVALNGTDEDALAAVRQIHGQAGYKFPKEWSDSQILRRVRDAEKEVTRGCDVEVDWVSEYQAASQNGQPIDPIAVIADCATTLKQYLARRSSTSTGQPKFDSFDLLEVVDGDFSEEWLIEEMLAKGQSQILGGVYKGMKTAIAVDMAVSLVTATPFLGRYTVPEKRRVTMMSGEGGLGPIQARAIALLNGKRDRYTAGDLTFSTMLPMLNAPLEELEQYLIERRTQVLIIDCAYLAMDGSAAGNVFAMGAQLRRAADLCSKLGITLVLLHHVTKSAGKENSPLELRDLSQAGFAEFARQWLLVSRRRNYTGGVHELYLSYGGFNRCGLLNLDIDEGTREQPAWKVNIQSKGEVYANESEAKHLKTVERLLTWKPEEGKRNWPLPKSRLAEIAKLSNREVDEILPRLIGERVFEVAPGKAAFSNGALYQPVTTNEAAA